MGVLYTGVFIEKKEEAKVPVFQKSNLSMKEFKQFNT